MSHVEIKVWVNEDRTVLVQQWNESMTVAVREDPDDVWGPPVQVERES